MALLQQRQQYMPMARSGAALFVLVLSTAGTGAVGDCSTDASCQAACGGGGDYSFISSPVNGTMIYSCTLNGYTCAGCSSAAALSSSPSPPPAPLATLGSTQGVTISIYASVGCSGSPSETLTTKGTACEALSLDGITVYGTFTCQVASSGSVQVCRDSQCADCAAVSLVAAGGCGDAFGFGASASFACNPEAATTSGAGTGRYI